MLASLGGDTPGTSRSYIRRQAGAEGREGEHANKLALYLKQLLGIAVTHTDEDRVHIAGPKRNGRECAVRRAKAERDEGGRAEEGNKRASAYEAFRISSSGSAGGGPRERRVPVSGQSVDKRVVRTVLNRSEYLYAGSLPSHLFCRCRRRRLPRVSTFRLRQRYLLDYPVLINSSGFIFIFTTPRSRQVHWTDRSFLWN